MTQEPAAAQGGQQQPPVTKRLAQFVHEVYPSDVSGSMREKLKELLLDYIGVAAAASTGADSTTAIHRGIANFDSTPGTNTVLNMGQKYSPQVAALLNGALSHSFDFDDTFAPGCLHPGTAIISATLAAAESADASTEATLTALAVGYEVVCRIAMQLADGSYKRGFHNTATAGIFGCIAAICSLRRLPAETVEMAFGLAASKAAGSMQFLENGSWNKRLHPGFAAYDAFLCVSLAEAGVVGAAECLEGRFGLFHAYSTRDPDLHALVKDLNHEWHFLGTALKPFAACRMTHGAIDIASQLARSVRLDGVEKITVTIRDGCYNIVGVPTPNKIHPQNIVDAQFSMYYQVAAAWLYGAGAGWSVYEKLGDPRIHQLSEKITVIGDATINGLETRMTVQWDDGRRETTSLFRPLGETSNPFTKDRVDEKFFGLAHPIYGKSKAVEIRDMVDNLENHSIRDVMSLVK
ncbi:hypothetical protein ASPBRDRAFT_429480 [Aspergillus brasiliensis CBS 101740]|uniref:MmgE/PrpD family protein n=1 Tax=Aspergillus brasiliensis (strain CBS 101740 / IMI 381727 / IBT 21946) TaxID=767769 RepID=A0A1L9U354_ASPBC|nr:hypothetical protein ASPBRDRAFT_429480 [Aspergillus brasiliensis CBS 101740]